VSVRAVLPRVGLAVLLAGAAAWVLLARKGFDPAALEAQLDAWTIHEHSG